MPPDPARVASGHSALTRLGLHVHAGGTVVPTEEKEATVAEGEEMRAKDGQWRETGAAQARPMDNELGGHHGLRPRMDEVMVQLDLADLDLRERVRQQLDTAVNVYLAARTRLVRARSDAEGGLSDLRTALDRVLHDLRSACEAADAVVRRQRD